MIDREYNKLNSIKCTKKQNIAYDMQKRNPMSTKHFGPPAQERPRNKIMNYDISSAQ